MAVPLNTTRARACQALYRIVERAAGLPEPTHAELVWAYAELAVR